MSKKKARLVSILCALMGIVVLGYVFVPIVIYEFQTLNASEFISPLANNRTATGSLDLTKASNWFVGAEQSNFQNNAIRFYNLNIPKLGIAGASVAIGGEDLSQSLIQYPGTAVPGQRGNSVVFGHSILPQFFNPRDYLSIFSTLPKLAKGDEIQIEYDGISYAYRVEDKFEVLPTDIQILEQNPSDSFLSLVTCVPPGDPRRPKRLVVRARIIPIEERI